MHSEQGCPVNAGPFRFAEVFTYTHEKLEESFKKSCGLIWWMILKEHSADWILEGQELIQGHKVS